MLFNSLTFVVFLAIVYTVWRLLPGVRSRNAWLLLGSYVFYGAWDWRFLGLLLLSTVVDYSAGLVMAGAPKPRRRAALVASLVIQLGFLGVYKYLDFGIVSMMRLLGWLGLDLDGPGADWAEVAELVDASYRLLAPIRLVRRLDAVAQRVDSVVQRADRQVLGQDGLMTDAQVAVRQLGALLQELRQSMVKVDAVLTEVQGVAANAREASTDLGALRADVESSLRKVDALITELNRKWPFAPRQQEVRLP